MNLASDAVVSAAVPPRCVGDLAGEAIGAVMAAEQRHDVRAVLREGEHGRLGVLVGERGREQADEDAGGADADDGAAVGEEAAARICGRALDDLGADERGEARRRVPAPDGGEGDDGGLHPQASSPR